MNRFDHLIGLDEEEKAKSGSDSSVSKFSQPKSKKKSQMKFLPKPKGFVNQSNFCYLNSIVQSLLFLPSFQKLLLRNNLPPNAQLLNSFKNLYLSEYLTATDGAGDRRNVLDATPIHDALGAVMKSRLFAAHQPDDQEDAQEFLTYILEVLHWELQPAGQRPEELARASPVASESGWLEKSRGGKVAERRVHRESDSPINKMFSGSTRVELRGGKTSGSTSTNIIVEPFYCFTVELQRNKKTHSPQKGRRNETGPEKEEKLTLEDALEYSTKMELLEGGYKRQQVIDTIPKVLVLHLRRIIYQDQELAKLFTHIDIPLVLTLNRTRLNLRAVIYHHGKTPYGGHYSCAVRVDLEDDDKWYFADDRTVSLTNFEHVTCPSSANTMKTPYLLFYERQDE
jgi:ubiquitin carboxyl-terminal hydrolase 10